MKQLSGKDFSEWVLENLKSNISAKNRINSQRNGSYKVLEMECGTGVSIGVMRTKGIQAWGFESSEKLLEEVPDYRWAYIQKANLKDFHKHIKILFDFPYDAIVSNNNNLHSNPDDIIIETLMQSSNLATWQFHVIEEQYQRPLEWWKDLAKKLGVRAEFYAFTK